MSIGKYVCLLCRRLSKILKLLTLKISPADLRKLFGTNECVSCDLTGADLVDANLTGADLGGANLEGANLFGADLWYADLRDLYLSSVLMKGAIFCNTTTPVGLVIHSGC